MTTAYPKEGELLGGLLWFRRAGSIITLGITNSALEEIGTVERLELPAEGDPVDSNEPIATLDGSVGRVEMISSWDGSVLEINEVAQKNLEMIMEDPLDEGWIIRIRVELDGPGHEE